jgi:hypothetical protein
MSQNALRALVSLKKDIKDTQKAIDMLMPACIGEALESFNGNNAIVYEDYYSKIIFKQFKEYDTPENNGDLCTIDHEIKEETQFIKDTNSILLKELDNRIEALIKKKEYILNTPKIQKLKQEYEETRVKTFNLKPQLAVTIK